MTKATVIPREQEAVRAAEPDYVGAAVAAAESLCRLPAIPTADWCDRGAAALTGLHPACAAVVLIATPEAPARLQEVHACGVSVRPVRDGGGLAADLRSRAERLAGADWAPSPRHDARGGADLYPTRHAPPVHAEVWRGLGFPDLAAGMAPINGGARCVVAYLAPLAGALTRGHAGALGALLGVLARRAEQTEWPSRPGGWVSPGEQQVLDRLVLGMSVREVAKELGRSPHTVHDHVKSLHRKLNATTRGQLVARALGHAGEAK